MEQIVTYSRKKNYKFRCNPRQTYSIASALKSNEAENSKTTQTEPISTNEENSEGNNIYPITWEEFDKIAVSKVWLEFDAMIIRQHGLNIYIY